MAEGGDRAYYTADTLARMLDLSLRLLHPFTPFVTEELWGHLKNAVTNRRVDRHSDMPLSDDWAEALIMASWPMPRAEEGWEAQKVADFCLGQDVVRVVRNLRADKKVNPGTRIPAILVGGEKTAILNEQAATIASLAKIEAEKMIITPRLEKKPEGHIALVASGVEIYMPLADMVDAEEERTRLEKDYADTRIQIDRLEKLLNSSFAEKAPAEVVQKERDRLIGFQETAQKLRSQLDNMT